ncbi:NAD-dependent epimerase/dehydratase family protein [Elusimicrobiota bacterium]
MLKRVLVTGGAGYVGSALVPKLLAAGHSVVVYDIMYYGSAGLPRHPALEVVSGDICDTPSLAGALRGADAVIHLACISNDPSFELDPVLGKSINLDSFEPMVKASKDAGVKRFINVSSSSVYGVSDADNVTEDHPLKPLTDYSKFKMMCEEILDKHRGDGFHGLSIRPATVCGYAPRMRLDLSVNILTNLAVNKRRITVFGGSQKRPNIHMDDITDLYMRLLELPADMIDGRIFNAGYHNHTIKALADMAKKIVESKMPEKKPIEIVTTSTDDLRSYHVCSQRIKDQLGFEARRTIQDAMADLCRAFAAGKIPDSLDDDRYYNVRTMKALAAGKGR